MSNLVKEFRELLGKTTQGEWFRDDQRNIVCTDKLFKSYTHSKSNADFIIKAHNDLPALLDELEDASHDASVQTEACLEWQEELNRYKEALEKCRETLIYIDGPTRDVKKGKATECLKQIEQILKGEEASDGK